MNDKYSKIILAGILICLIVIALKPVPYFSSNPNVTINSGEQIIQLAPNRIAIVDTRSNSGMRRNILVFDYNSSDKTFNYAGTFNYEDYFSNSQKYGIPQN